MNQPARAVTGHNWTGRSLCFRDAPIEYRAIHFHEDDLEDARWDPDLEIQIPESLRSGIYAARLSAGGLQDHIPFVVHPPAGRALADVVLLLPTFTYLAYANERAQAVTRSVTGLSSNAEIRFGPLDRLLQRHPEWGLSLYDRHADGSGSCYSSRLRPVPNLRPCYTNWLTGAPRHLGADLYVADWLEEKRIPFDVVTDEDLHVAGVDLLRRYRVVLTGGHPEYQTERTLTALQRYVRDGGKLLYLGGNGFYWVASVDPERPHVMEVRRGFAGTRTWESDPGEAYHSTTGEPGGLWRHRGRPANKLTGVGFAAQGWDRDARGYRRLDASFDPEVAWIFDGIDEDEVIGNFGLLMNGAAGDEIDRYDPALGSPVDTFVLATAGGFSEQYQPAAEDLLSSSSHSSDGRAGVRSDVTFFRNARAGAVFAASSMCWIGALSHRSYTNNVSRIMENLLRRFVAHHG